MTNLLTTKPPPPPPAPLPEEAMPEPPLAARWQRIALIVGVLLVGWIALQLFSSILLPFVLSAGIAYFLDPAARRLTRLGVPRGPAALLLVVGLIALVFLFILLLYPLILQQIGLLVARVPAYAIQFSAWAGKVLSDLQDSLGPGYIDTRLRDLVSSQAGSIISFLVSAVTSILGGGFAIFNVLSLLVVTPVVSFYLLRDWPLLVARIDAWLPRRYAGVIRAQAREVDRILSAWVRGQALCCLVLALFYAMMLSLVGLDLGLIVGLMAGVLSFIPYVGTITGAVSSIGLAFAQFPDWHGVARVAAVFISGQLLEGYIIYPRFLGDRVELHAVWVIFALFAGGAAFGFLGVLLAVPMAATIGVLARFWLRRYMASHLYLDPPGAP